MIRFFKFFFNNDALPILKICTFGIRIFSFLLPCRLFYPMFFLTSDPSLKEGHEGEKEERGREDNPGFRKCCAHGSLQGKNHLMFCCCSLVICIDSVTRHLLASDLPSIFCLFS